MPVSHLQATPQEEVENAIQEDNEPLAEGTVPAEPATQPEAVAESANATEATEETLPESETSPIDTSAQSVKQAASEAYDSAARTLSDMAPGAGSYGQKTRSEMIAEPKPTIYIGNLFFDVTETDLKKELGRFGEVVNCRLMRDSRGLSKG